MRIYGFVFAAVYKWRKKAGAQGAVLINMTGKGGSRVGLPSRECCHAGKMYLLELAQKGMKVKGAMMLATCMLTEKDILGKKHKLITVSSRVANHVPQAYRKRGFAAYSRVTNPWLSYISRKLIERGMEGQFPPLTDQEEKYG